MSYGTTGYAWGIGLVISHAVAFLFFQPAQAFVLPAPDIVETSSIVFIPGIQASRLYTQGTFENRLWEPNRNADVEKLFLTDTGESVLPNIYTRDVIDETVVYNIYKKFLSFLGQLQDDFIITQWSVLPYDWRYDPKYILAHGINFTNGGHINVLNEIRARALSSPSGKITLITHSNGALLAKEIINQLGEEEAANLIDQLIMVAPPQLGTPKAITSLLHGDGQDILDGFLVHKDTARELAEDMKSAYALLPSAEYFNRVDTDAQPLVEFDSSVDAVGWASLRQQYGSAINTYDELKSFLTGENGARSEPSAADVFTPTVLKSSFLNEEESSHTGWDAWQPPEGMKVTQIAGWGLNTIRGLRYFTNTSYACPSGSAPCAPFSILDHEPLFTKDGDETVVTPSTEALNTQIYYLDLHEHNKELRNLRRNRAHKDILEVEPLQELLSALIQKQGIVDLPTNISSTKPDDLSNLTIRVHSPVKVDVYDSVGNHTGVISNHTPGSDIPLVEEKIPNSAYYEVGEGKYVTLDTEDTYQLNLQGTALGTVTLKIEETQGDSVVGSKTFTDIPVTPSTEATVTTQTAATTSQLALDIEGDGKVDATLGENTKLNPITNIVLLEKIIQASSMTKPAKIAFIAELEAVKKLIERNNKLAAKVLLNVVVAELKTKRDLGITKEQAAQLTYMVQQIRNAI